MFDQPATRRLAAIVSVDVAGYSALAERDEAAAVGLVSTVAALVRDAAAAHDGRVFNTAGDGFMLEFPTASGALGAVQAIRASAPAPLRIAVHLGEVAVTPTGDLLGHGVNVAARIQALARPGEILISADVKRALRGSSDRGMASRGRVRLDKMSETTEVFAYGLGPKGGRPFPRLRPPPLVAIAAALAATAALAAWAWSRLADEPGPEPLRVAVLRIDAPPGEARTFARSLHDALRATLADRGMPVMSRDAAQRRDHGRARLLLHGGTEFAGDAIRLRLQIDDAPAGLSVWALTLERPVSEATALQDQATWRVADVVEAAGHMFEDGPPPDAETLGAYMRYWELSRLGRYGAPQFLPLARQVAAATPNASRAHSMLANTLAVAPTGDRVLTGRQFQEARAEAERALALDRNNGDAYVALANLVRHDDRMERLRLLREGLTVDPQNPNLLFLLGDLLREVGRAREAAPIHRLALTVDPLSPSRVAANIFVLSSTGAVSEAEALARRWTPVWPDRFTVRRAAVNSALLYSAPEAALAALDAYQKGEPSFSPEAETAWRDFARARASGVYPKAVSQALRRAAMARAVDMSTAVAALAQAGDVDGAFMVAEYALAADEQLYTSVLFEAAAAPMRKDPRFFPLVARLGIADFWRRTGDWADFCAEPGEAARCRAAA